LGDVSAHHRGDARFQVISYDKQCNITVSAVMAVTPDLAAKYHLPAALIPSTSGVQPDSQGSGSGTCRASQTMHDVAGLVLAETDTFQPWSYNGSVITGYGQGHTGTSYSPDGWNSFNLWFNNGFAGWSAQMQFNGGATFQWLAGSFTTTMTNNGTVTRSAGCSASFTHSATVPGGSYTQGASIQ